MGKLIVIDGTDGCGKETQMNLLEQKLKERNINYKKVDFPNYDSPSSGLVKMYLNGEFGEDADEVSPYIASTFYAADRYATYKIELQKFYENGGLILADRYTTANMIHQAGKIKDKLERKKFLDWLCDLEFNIYKIPKPDKVFFLNMPIEYTEELMKNRKNKYDGKEVKDIHERNEKHLQNSYEAACELAKEYNWNEISCIKDKKIRTREEISEEIFNGLKEIL